MTRGRDLRTFSDRFQDRGTWFAGVIVSMAGGRATTDSYDRGQPRTHVPLHPIDSLAPGLGQSYLTSRAWDLPAPAGSNPWIV